MKNTRNLTAAIELIGIGILAIVAMIFLNGCTYTTLSDPATGRAVARVVAPWAPWQDTSQALSKLTVTSRTNAFTASLNGYGAQETTSSNAVQLIQAIAAGAVQGAVAASQQLVK